MKENSLVSATELLALHDEARRRRTPPVDSEKCLAYISDKIEYIMYSLEGQAKDSTECTVHENIEAWAYEDIIRPFLELGYKCRIKGKFKYRWTSKSITRMDPDKDYCTVYEVEISAERSESGFIARLKHCILARRARKLRNEYNDEAGSRVYGLVLWGGRATLLP